MIKSGEIDMAEKELLIEFYRDFIASIIDTGDLELFLKTMDEEVEMLMPPNGETIH